jgi:hypothetical protein
LECGLASQDSITAHRERELNAKTAAFARLGFHRNRTAAEFQRFLHQSETDARARIFILPMQALSVRAWKFESSIDASADSERSSKKVTGGQFEKNRAKLADAPREFIEATAKNRPRQSAYLHQRYA